MRRWWTDGRFSSPQRAAGVGLVLFQAAALGVLMKAPVFAGCAAAIALGGWLAPRHQLIRNFNQTYAFSFTALVFVLKYAFAPAEFDFDRSFVNTPLAYETACCCIVIQLQALFLKEYVNRLPMWFLGISVMTLILTCDIRVRGSEREWMLVCIAGFSTAWLVFAASTRHRVSRPGVFRFGFRERVMAGVAIVSISAGSALSVALHRHESQLEQVLTAYLALGAPTTARSGFSNQGGLADVSVWKTYGGNLIALEIDYPERPGYLRGRVFDRFDHDRWETSAWLHTLTSTFPDRSLTPPWPHRHAYALHQPIPDDLTEMAFWPIPSESGNRFFLPQHSVVLACDCPSVYLDAARSTSHSDQESVTHYTALVSRDVISEDSATDWESYLDLSEALDPVVHDVAEEVFSQARTPQEKMAAVETFFRDHFQYQLGVQIPHRRNRLAHFLTQRPAAHCEYFATAAAILLRLSGVPTRYVTGFVVEERNSLHGKWVARRKDAHAWVEAYDFDSRRWVIVEATPAAGLPRGSSTNWREQLAEAAVHYGRRTRNWIQRTDFWQIASNLFLLVAVATMGVVLISAARWGWTSFEKRARHPDRTDEFFTRLTRERQRIDRFLLRRGIHRLSEETVLQFANRLEFENNLPRAPHFAEWYRSYLTLRFGNFAPDAQALQDLEEVRRTLTQVRRRYHD